MATQWQHMTYYAQLVSGRNRGRPDTWHFTVSERFRSTYDHVTERCNEDQNGEELWLTLESDGWELVTVLTPVVDEVLETLEPADGSPPVQRTMSRAAAFSYFFKRPLPE